MRALVPMLALTVFVGAASAQTPGFWLVGLPAGATQGSVAALSRDGLVAAGNNGPVGAYSPGFTWTRQGGRTDFGLEAGMPHVTSPAGLSNDGSSMVGVMWNQATYPAPDTRAFLRVGSGPLQDLGVLPSETRSYARGVSGDGSVVVGSCEHSPSTEFVGQAFRWTAQTGMIGLGYTHPNASFSQARAISSDGGTIVGISTLSGAYIDAFAWTQAGGMQALPFLPGSTHFEAEANAASAAGSVIVGSAASGTSGFYHAVRWTGGAIQDLGLPAGQIDSMAFAVSADGSIVGGLSDISGGSLAWVWTQSSGMRLLSDLLSASGISVPSGYRLDSVLAISADGQTYAGQAVNLTTNTREGFVATVPAPPSALALLLLPALKSRSFAAARARSTTG